LSHTVETEAGTFRLSDEMEEWLALLPRTDDGWLDSSYSEVRKFNEALSDQVEAFVTVHRTLH